MHDARLLGGKGKPRRLLNRERIHVGAEPKALPPLRPGDDGDDTGAADPGPDFEAGVSQRLGQKRRGLVLLEGELGALVDVAAKRDETVGEALNGLSEVREHGHSLRSA